MGYLLGHFAFRSIRNVAHPRWTPGTTQAHGPFSVWVRQGRFFCVPTLTENSWFFSAWDTSWVQASTLRPSIFQSQDAGIRLGRILPAGARNKKSATAVTVALCCVEQLVGVALYGLHVEAEAGVDIDVADCFAEVEVCLLDAFADLD